MLLKRRKSQIHFSALLALAALLASGVTASAAVKPSKAAGGVSVTPSPVVVALPSAPTVLTYRAWKNLRIDEARLVLERITFESQLEKAPAIERSPGEKQAVVKGIGASPTPSRSGSRAENRIDSRIEQAQMNLEIAQDLAVKDYMDIYLSKFKSRDVIVDVARRMSPEEMAEVLLSYQKLSDVAAAH